jgi:DNA helicase HerA-like ATPase
VPRIGLERVLAQDDAKVVLRLGDEAVGVDELPAVARPQGVPLVDVAVHEDGSFRVVGPAPPLGAVDGVVDGSGRARSPQRLPRLADALRHPRRLLGAAGQVEPVRRPPRLAGAADQDLVALTHRHAEAVERRAQPLHEVGAHRLVGLVQLGVADAARCPQDGDLPLGPARLHGQHDLQHGGGACRPDGLDHERLRPVGAHGAECQPPPLDQVGHQLGEVVEPPPGAVHLGAATHDLRRLAVVQRGAHAGILAASTLAVPVISTYVRPMAGADDFGARIGAAYAAEGGVIDLGRALLGGTVHQDAVVQIPLSMCNRHGLIAGATGTGKTKTLQLMAEQLSAQGVPVFAADIKGDLSGLSRPGEAGDRVTSRAADLGIEWAPAGSPVTFLSLGGIGPGVPVRATISSFGPHLLAKVLGANDVQTSSLALVFHYADTAGLALLDLSDLRAVLQFLTSDAGKAALDGIGGLSKATAGVLLRSIIELETQGGGAFFGEPELHVADLMRTTPEGQGVISCLELAAAQDKPKLFSTFLLWLLAELFEELPEVGDLDKPKLVFFFDEAHLLFDDAPEAFLDQVAQTVRLIRSKGVGVFFVTQLPDDVPEEVLAQLGNRVQHALRAFTPRDATALKAAVTTYPKTDDYDLDEDLTQLGTGEAMVTILSERGAPTPVAWTRLRPPRSSMAALDPTEVDRAAHDSSLWSTYATPVDRESARELLAAKAAKATDQAPTPQPKAKKGKAAKEDDDNPIVDYLKSREGRSMMNTVARGVFGLLKKRR